MGFFVILGERKLIEQKKKMKKLKGQLEKFKRGLFIKTLMALVSGHRDKALRSVVVSCLAPVMWIYDTIYGLSLVSNETLRTDPQALCMAGSLLEK